MIITELAKEFKGEFSCQEKITEKFPMRKKFQTLMLNMIFSWYATVHAATGITKNILMKTYRRDLLIHTNIVTIISIYLIWCCEKVFIHKMIWMNRKNSMKRLYLKKNIFTVTKTWNILLMQITSTQKEFTKNLK